MSAPEFFIDNDAHGDPWVWRENGDQPIQVLNLLHIAPEHAPLLNLIRAAVEGEVCEEWGVRWRGITFHCGSRASAFAQRDAEFTGPFRRTVITGAWEEER